MAMTYQQLPEWAQQAARLEADRRGVELQTVLVDLWLWARVAPEQVTPTMEDRARRRPDDAFKQRLAFSMDRNQDLLDRLAQT